MSTGLFMLQPQVSVTVTREEYHQQVLTRYPITDAGYKITAELVWCTIGSGKYRGQRGIEVRLGGERVGELTYAMSQRYGAMLELVCGRGYRAGCEAYVFQGKRGVEIELRLPRENSQIVFPVVPVSVPSQVGRVGAARKNGVAKPGWIAAGVAGAVLLIAVVSNQGAESPSADSGPVANVTTSSSTASSKVVAPPVTTTTTTTTSLVPPPPPPPVEPNVPAPPAPPAPPAKTSKTTRPAPPPKNTPAPPPPPASKCDPNYSGCVPIAEDVDCKPGSGNGPAYVRGPIQVIGTDIYGLDADNDGIACE